MPIRKSCYRHIIVQTYKQTSNVMHSSNYGLDTESRHSFLSYRPAKAQGAFCRRALAVGLFRNFYRRWSKQSDRSTLQIYISHYIPLNGTLFEFACAGSACNGRCLPDFVGQALVYAA